MVTLQLHAIHSLLLLVIALNSFTYAAPLESYTTNLLSHQLLKKQAPYSLTTHDKVNKTILLTNGAAENRITFILRLRQFEAITAIIHLSTDPTIITATSETRHQLPYESQNAINFTLLHEFDGRVGVARYNFLVFTNATRYRATGTYTVAGIVVYASHKRTAVSIASGINSPGLAFKPPSPENSTDGGTLRLEVEYQPVGSDITGKPPSLKRVLSNAGVKVKDIMQGVNSTLVTYDESCSLTESSMKSLNVSMPSMRCGICFNDTDKSLSISINPERSGTSVIQISLPDIEVDNEIFETDIRVFVKKPSVVNPVVLIQPGTKVLLDYYGTEVIYVQMYNIIQPDQPVNATHFFIDLDMNRYASADISLSRFEQPIQTIAFIVQPPGKEDQAILKKIQTALMGLNDSELDSLEQTPDVLSTIEPLPTMSMPVEEDLAPAKFALGPFNLENTTALPIEGNYPMVRMTEVGINGASAIEQLRISSVPLRAVYIRMSDDMGYYESNAHVVIPPSPSLRTAKNVLNNPFLTMFAPNETAVVSSIPSLRDSEHFLVSLYLANYSIPTFSEHKSRQISSSLVQAIGNVTDGHIVSGNLTHLKANATGIHVTYALPVQQDAERIVRDVLGNKVDIGNQVAESIWIPSNRLVLTNAMAFDPASTSIIDAVSNPDSFLGGLSGPLLAVIIVLVVAALVPLTAVCIGYMVAGTDPEQAEPSTHFSGDPSTSFTRTPPILRDAFGRGAGEEEQESFMNNEEMRRQGYRTTETAPSVEY